MSEKYFTVDFSRMPEGAVLMVKKGTKLFLHKNDDYGKTDKARPFATGNLCVFWVNEKKEKPKAKEELIEDVL